MALPVLRLSRRWGKCILLAKSSGSTRQALVPRRLFQVKCRSHQALIQSHRMQAILAEGDGERERSDSTVVDDPTAVSLVNLSEHHVPSLVSLNQESLPMNYGKDFYSNTLRNRQYCQVAVAHDDPQHVVGAVCARLDLSHPRSPKLYITCLAVRAGYKRAGLGKLLVEHVLEAARTADHINDVYLHVQTDNESALSLYESLDFTYERKIEGFYQIGIAHTVNYHADCYQMHWKKAIRKKPQLGPSGEKPSASGSLG